MDKPIGPFPYAVAAFAVSALLEYPLAKKYPLKEPISTGRRMLVAGTLGFLGTYAAFYIVAGVYSQRKLKP
jgi:hypothetical protein